MSSIVKMIDDMDVLLQAVAVRGRELHCFILQEDEWAEIKERLLSDGPIADADLGDTFRGVPVEFGTFTNPYSVGLICREVTASRADRYC